MEQPRADGIPWAPSDDHDSRALASVALYHLTLRRWSDCRLPYVKSRRFCCPLLRPTISLQTASAVVRRGEVVAVTSVRVIACTTGMAISAAKRVASSFQRQDVGKSPLRSVSARIPESRSSRRSRRSVKGRRGGAILQADSRERLGWHVMVTRRAFMTSLVVAFVLLSVLADSGASVQCLDHRDHQRAYRGRVRDHTSQRAGPVATLSADTATDRVPTAPLFIPLSASRPDRPPPRGAPADSWPARQPPRARRASR